MLLEFAFFGFGVYLYLFATGRIKVEQASAQKAAAFREKNGWWLRLGGLAVMAIMAINIYLHLLELMG